MGVYTFSPSILLHVLTWPPRKDPRCRINPLTAPPVCLPAIQSLVAGMQERAGAPSGPGLLGGSLSSQPHSCGSLVPGAVGDCAGLESGPREGSMGGTEAPPPTGARQDLQGTEDEARGRSLAVWTAGAAGVLGPPT